MKYTPDQIISCMETKGYSVAKNQDKAFNVNIIGIRNAVPVVNYFCDVIEVLYLFKDQWYQQEFPATTDPGLYWLQNPMNVEGTGILKPGQYKGMWSLGKHNGYDALVQTGNCTLYRDNDRDGNLDIIPGTEETGLFGINCHHAGSNAPESGVNKWSAGCQVIQSRDVFEKIFLPLCKAGAKNWGNSFTYTLLGEREITG